MAHVHGKTALAPWREKGTTARAQRRIIRLLAILPLSPILQPRGEYFYWEKYVFSLKSPCSAEGEKKQP
jgi:hypothetical protein